MPISGGWANRCCFGAEPSRGGKLLGIASNLSGSVSSPHMIVAMAHDTLTEPGSESANALDLDGIDAELDAVEVALVRLENGTYFVDEITGKPLDDQLLAKNPIARRA